jgi:UDP-glucose 4-epimerase
MLDWPVAGFERPSHHIVLLFGLGLIGSAILAAVMTRVVARRRDLPFAWHEDGDRVGQSAAILSFAREVASAQRGEEARVSIVWSAGRAGFASSTADLMSEQHAFAEVLDIGRRLHDFTESTSFHLLSSAGGLFEGQRHIDAACTPAPLRPYGVAKLEQEERLGALSDRMAIVVYRPTSVYGYAGAQARRGFVAALVQNAIRNETTRIFGGSDTIRDYVFVDDVGSFIAEQLVTPRPEMRKCLLASGKPTAMLELTAIVENTLQRKLYFQYEAEPSNALSVSVRPSSLPKGWRPTPLAIGIYRTAARIIDAYRVPVH